MKGEIITGLCVAIPSIIATILSYIATVNKNKEANTLIQYRIEQLEKKVDTYNSFSERVAVVERDLKTAFTRIDELKKGDR